jgi:alpha-L-rhamnosidase
VVIKPQVVGTLTHVSGRRETPHGTVSSTWTRGAHGVSSMHVSIPAGTTATVYVPAAHDESFVPVGADATPTGRVPGYQVFTVRPGDVTFRKA